MNSGRIDTLAKKIWDYMLLHQELGPMDGIFALGSNDTSVAKHAGQLYLEGYGKYVICAGRNGKASDFEKPEAEIFAEILYGMGVPEDKLILERESSNTGENVVFVKALLERTGLDLHSFLLVQKPYMERRTYATFRKQWPEADCTVTSPQISYEDYAGNQESKERFLNVMVGDLQRIREYPTLGFQIEQDIPDDVWRAWKELVALGFDTYYLKDTEPHLTDR